MTYLRPDLYSNSRNIQSSEAEFMNVYNFVEVSEHNLESYHTWGFCMDLWNHRDGKYGFPPFSFTVYSNWIVETVRGCVSLKKYKSQGKEAVEQL
jgi:hypothetical protein